MAQPLDFSVKRRISVVTAGHLATCPRMLKAADAFYAAGYDVRTISTRTGGWASAADADIASSRGWRSRVVSYDRREAAGTWLRSGARYKAARAVANMVTPVPASVATAAFARVHRELVDAILEEPTDLIYGGTTGAIAAVAEAGRRSGTPFAVDFEDFHCAEHDPSQGDLSNTLGAVVMKLAADQAAFVTAGSAAIARACREELDIAAIPIHNVFPLPPSPPAVRGGEPEFSTYWFSQTIGANRGLEDIVRALGFTGLPASVNLRGCAVPGYLEALRAVADHSARRVQIRILPPVAPARMVDACRSFDAGIASEPGRVRNNVLALSNKATTYPLAGLPVLITDTVGQHPLIEDLREGALAFAPGDCEALAGKLLPLMTDHRRRREASQASWEAARTRWHWEHELERGALLAAVERVIS